MSELSNFISSKLLPWYDHHGRSTLPWRHNISAYRVWLSEVMLQQTQVVTVIPYFETFIKKFPTVKKLAAADEDDILHLWSGLGYYSRGRNLHKAAKKIVADFNGEFPSSVELLETLPGVGRSTAGAIAAIAYQVSAPILDGNVKRVLARFHAIQTWPGETKNLAQLWQYATEHTPLHRANDYTQAIMDLGATLCRRKNPLCLECPLQTKCLAYKNNQQHQLPISKPKKIIPIKAVNMIIFENDKEEILLEKRPPVGIWGGLWSLPECDVDINISDYCQKIFAAKSLSIIKLEPLKHTFSHYHLLIYPYIASIKEHHHIAMEYRHINWYTLANEFPVGLPAPIKKILRHYHESKNTLSEIR